MALTVEVLDRETFGQTFSVSFVEVTFDSSYPTGGESLTPASIGLDSVSAVFVDQPGTHTVVYDRANSKVKAFWGDYSNASDGPAVEVADTTNLSTVKFRALVFGK